MSVSESPLPASAPDCVWHQHKTEIQDLYQSQRKTLKEVKYLMEQKGFPEKPLSTWETKLRDVLRLRKKAKATNWPLIYQHVLPRLQNPGQKSLKKETNIYLNGSEIPWDKAWKEMRRSKATLLPSRQRPPRPLPPGIVIRTPSPVSGPSTLPIRSAQPTGDVAATRFKHTTQDIILKHNLDTVPTAHMFIGDGEWRSLAQKAVSVYQDCATTIPWLDLHQALQHFFHCAHVARRLDGHLYQKAHEPFASVITSTSKQFQTHEPNINFQFCFELLPADYPIPPRPSHDLGCRVARSAARFELNQFISTAMYLLSNDLHDHDDGDRGLDLFCSILECNASQIINLLCRQLPSIKSTWINLLRYSLKNERGDTFRFMVDIGLRNAWLQSGLLGELLHACVQMDCNNTLKDLLAHNFPDQMSRSGASWWTGSLDAVTAAIRQDKAECFRILLEHCDFSAQTWQQQGAHKEVIFKFWDLIHTSDAQNASEMRALEFLSTIGANVDAPVPLFNIGCQWWGVWKLWHPLETYSCPSLSILDYCFYFHRPMYEKLAPNSKVSTSEISRAGILLSLKRGASALQDYLVARVGAHSSSGWQRAHSFLELVLGELLTLQDRIPSTLEYRWSRLPGSGGIDTSLVISLIQYGVDLDLPSLAIGIQDLLGSALRHLSRSCTDAALELVTILIGRGAVLKALHLRMAVEAQGLNALECLSLLVVDFPVKAVAALAEAARLNNFEAAEFLIRAGVNPCSFIPPEELENKISRVSSYSIQAIAVGCDWHDRNGSSCAMMQLLARFGARLVVTPNDCSPFDIIEHLLLYSSHDTFRKVKYVMQVLQGCNKSSRIPSCLLESCFSSATFYLWYPETEKGTKEENKGRLELFEYLISQGAPVSPGSCLAALIHVGGREALIEKVVRLGADLNAYHRWGNPSRTEMVDKFTPLQAAARRGNERLVRLLLGVGSNVNSRACRGQGGQHSHTALQAICFWDTATEEEYDRKRRICQLMISHGADTNGAPARVGGYTALQYAAMAGHLEIAALLLRNGARVNAPSGRPDGKLALDLAVGFGRLDMVKFLLNANALSSFRGATGYDGAIKLAECRLYQIRENRGYFAIADLIRKHAANNMALGLMNPELLKPQEDYHIYGYATLEDYCDPEFAGEDCTVDSLCRNCMGRAPDGELMDEAKLLD